MQHFFWVLPIDSFAKKSFGNQKKINLTVQNNVMYKTLFYIIIGFFSINTFAQKDTLQITSLLDKAYEIEISNPDEAINQYRKTYELSIKSKCPT